MKVEIEFPGDFSSDEPLPIHLGRLRLGTGGVVRIVLLPTGGLTLLVSKESIENGGVIVIDHDSNDVLGFPRSTE